VQGRNVQLDFSFQAPEPSRRPKEPSPKEPTVLTVRELTATIRRLLEDKIGRVWVRGEISNHRRQASGHHYFTLKDENSQIACVLFSGDARLLRGLKMEDGLAVQVAGEISVYEVRGQYQLIVRHVQMEGAGLLQAKFEELKKRLEAEGLFATERKRRLPPHPRRIGVVTSPTGAALQDFLNVLWRRNPQIEVLLCPVRVQGTGAAKEIVEAIARLNDPGLPGGPPDVVVVTRGGGSLEDLWEFNEEVVARAVAASGIPVISAVGHEIDFTICDFAADLRAPTPSAAAELISEDALVLRKQLLTHYQRMARICRDAVREQNNRLARVLASGCFRRPERLLREFAMELDSRAAALVQIPATRHQKLVADLARARSVLLARHPERWVSAKRQTLEGQVRRLRPLAMQKGKMLRERLGRIEQVLKAFDPNATLARGFTLTFDEFGKLLKTRQAAQAAAKLTTRFPDGEVQSTPNPPPPV